MREITIKICVTMFRHPLNTNNDLKKKQQKTPRNLCVEFWFVDVRHFLCFVGKLTTELPCLENIQVNISKM